MSQDQEKVYQVLNAILKEKFPQATEVNIKPVSSKGANYSSILYQGKVVTQNETIDVFAKVAAMGDKFAEASNQVFVTEEFVYKKLSNAYEKLQNNHGIVEQRFTFPKFYTAIETDGLQIILMENLASKGYECYDRLKCISWQYAAKCIETLANFHALSLALSKEYPEEFKLAGEIMKLPPLTEGAWGGIEGLADAALAAVDEVDREKLSQLLEDSVGWSKFQELTDHRKTPVIVHGDYRASNLMHKEVDGDLHVIPVDYQTARLGCPVGDLIYFITMGTDQQFRRQHYHQLVDHYYEQLALALTRLDLLPDEVYGREEFESDMKAKLPIGLCMAAMGLPFVTVDPANAPNFEQGQFVPRASELFVQRFRELMDDFKQWGFI